MRSLNGQDEPLNGQGGSLNGSDGPLNGNDGALNGQNTSLNDPDSESGSWASEWRAAVSRPSRPRRRSLWNTQTGRVV